MSSIQLQSLRNQQLTLPSDPVPSVRKPAPGYIAEAPITAFHGTQAQPPTRRSLVLEGRVQRRESLRQQTKRPSALPSHMVKEILETRISKDKERDKKKRRKEAKEKAAREMAPPKRRSSSVSSDSSSSDASPKLPSTANRSKTKSRSKDIDWSDVTDPEERRRIQNRIAQRKFREKTKDNKEKAEREARNQQYAGNSYRIPTAEDFLNDTESDGLPWGGFNFGHAVLRGHESEGRRSSGRGTYVADDSLQTQAPVLAPVSTSAPFVMPYSQAMPQAAPSFETTGADNIYMEESSYGYGQVMPAFGPLPPHQ